MKPLHHCSLARDCLQREPEKLVMSSAAYLAAATCRDPQKVGEQSYPGSDLSLCTGQASRNCVNKRRKCRARALKNGKKRQDGFESRR